VIVRGNERALFYSAGSGMSKTPVGSGWYWHLPWNHYVKYDLRWKQHEEQIHIHSMDGLHMDVTLVVVVRPNPAEIYDLDLSVGPGFYEQVVRPAVFAASRDASGKFKHLEIATKTHMVEAAIGAALLEHLKGQHIEVADAPRPCLAVAFCSEKQGEEPTSDPADESSPIHHRCTGSENGRSKKYYFSRQRSIPLGLRASSPAITGERLLCGATR
jgi:hypothetical protein